MGFLSLWFGNFQKIRKLVGGLWIYCEVDEINFRKWVKLDDDLAIAFYRFNSDTKIKHENYIVDGKNQDKGVIK